MFVYFLFLFFLVQSLFCMRQWARFPSSPESGLLSSLIFPNCGWLSSLICLFTHFIFFFLLFSFILHVSFYSSSFLAVSLFVCPFSFIPVNLFQTYRLQWNPGSSNLLMMSSPNRFPSRLFCGAFRFILRPCVFRFVFLKIHNKLTDFFLSLFFQKVIFFYNNRRNTLLVHLRPQQTILQLWA